MYDGGHKISKMCTLSIYELCIGIVFGCFPGMLLLFSGGWLVGFGSIYGCMDLCSHCSLCHGVGA